MSNISLRNHRHQQSTPPKQFCGNSVQTLTTSSKSQATTRSTHSNMKRPPNQRPSNPSSNYTHNFQSLIYIPIGSHPSHSLSRRPTPGASIECFQAHRQSHICSTHNPGSIILTKKRPPLRCDRQGNPPPLSLDYYNDTTTQPSSIGLL